MSICLQKNIKTPKGLQIVRRAERALMNERVRLINNTLNMVRDLRDTCIDQLREVLNEDWMDKCREFIEVRRGRTTSQDLNQIKREGLRDFQIENR